MADINDLGLPESGTVEDNPESGTVKDNLDEISSDVSNQIEDVFLDKKVLSEIEELVKTGKQDLLISDLENYNKKYYKSIVLCLLDNKKGYIFIKNIESFKGFLDQDVIFKIIDIGGAISVKNNIKYFSSYSIDEVNKKLEDTGNSRYVIEQYENLDNLDLDSIIDKLIEIKNTPYMDRDTKKYRILLDKVEGKTDGGDYSYSHLTKDLVIKLIKNDLCRFYLLNTVSFLDKEIAYLLLNTSRESALFLLNNIDRFEGYDNKIIRYIRKLDEKYYDLCLREDRIDDYDFKIDNILGNICEDYFIDNNIGSFLNEIYKIGFDPDDELLILLFEEHGFNSFNSILNDNLLNKKILLYIIDNFGESDEILIEYLGEYLKYFIGLDNDIAKKLLEIGGYDLLVQNGDKFELVDFIKLYFNTFGDIYNETIFEIYNDLYQKGDKKGIELFLKEIEENKRNIFNNNSYEIETNFGVTKDFILQLFFPKRDYSPRNIDEYEDKNKHLDGYNFNRDGYNFTLSNLLGYSLIDGEKMNTNLLKKYKTRIENISTISSNNNSLKNAIKDYSKKFGIKLESKSLESQILEYLLKKKENGLEIDLEDFDLLIGYQLKGRYDDFIRSSNDKLNSNKDSESQYMIQILALLKEYGDPLKESIRSLERNVIESEDKSIFEKYIKSVPKEVGDLTKSRIINSLINSYSRRPLDKIKIEDIQKTINTKLKSTLQKSDVTEEEIVTFSKLFTVEDVSFLEDIEKQELFRKKWIREVEEYFGSTDTVGLNIRQISRVQSNIYNELQSESSKFESKVDKGSGKERKVFARFGKNKYDGYARGVGDVCLGLDANMWKNENYFELVLFDRERLKNIGTVMLLNMEEPDGKKYLLYGPNPSVEFVDKVSSEKLYEKLSDLVIDFAKNNNFDGVIFSSTHGWSTNRGGDFQTALEKSQLLDENGEILKIDLKKGHLLGNGVGEDYIYQFDLSYLWKK